MLLLLASSCFMLAQALHKSCDASLASSYLLHGLAALLLALSWLLGARLLLQACCSWLLGARRAPLAMPRAVLELGTLEEASSSGGGGGGEARALGPGPRRLAPLAAEAPRAARFQQQTCEDRGVRSGHCLVSSLAMVSLLWLVGFWYWCGRYEVWEREVDARWGFLINGQTPEEESAPVWLGEFGTASDNAWWQYLMRYLREQEVDYAYWAFNGEKRNDENESYGIVSMDGISVRHPWKLENLQALMTSASQHVA